MGDHFSTVRILYVPSEWNENRTSQNQSGKTGLGCRFLKMFHLSPKRPLQFYLSCLLVCCSMRSANNTYWSAVSRRFAQSGSSLGTISAVILPPPSMSSPAVEAGCWDLCCGGRASLPSGLQQGVATKTPAPETHSDFMWHQQDTKRNSSRLCQVSDAYNWVQEGRTKKKNNYEATKIRNMACTKVCCELFWDDSTFCPQPGLCLHQEQQAKSNFWEWDWKPCISVLAMK